MEISKTTHQPASAFKGIQAWMQQHPMFSFFFLAYALSWIVFIPYVLAERGILEGNFTFFYILHTFGPAIAAIVMTSILTGRTGLQNLRQRVRQVRAPWQWYLFLLAGIPVLVMVGIILQPGAMEGYKGFTTNLLVRYPFYLITAFLGVGLGEETGWRGFALPHMQKQYSPLWGTLFLGVLWSCWHLPDFLTASKGGGAGTSLIAFLTNFSIFTAGVVSLSVIMTWIYNHTQGSLFIAILAHASVDAPEVAGWTALFPAVSMIGLHWALPIAFGLPAFLIILLTRGRLGYKPDQAQP